MSSQTYRSESKLSLAVTACVYCHLLFDSLFLLFIQMHNSRMTITTSKTRIARAANPPPTKMKTLLLELLGALVEEPRIWYILLIVQAINYMVHIVMFL